MKVSNLSKIIVIVICSLMLCACGINNPEDNGSNEVLGTCFITIEGYCDNREVEVYNGDSVYDILKKSGANVSARSSGYCSYTSSLCSGV